MDDLYFTHYSNAPRTGNDPTFMISFPLLFYRLSSVFAVNGGLSPGEC
jgi:hypothetical protein